MALYGGYYLRMTSELHLFDYIVGHVLIHQISLNNLNSLWWHGGSQKHGDSDKHGMLVSDGI